MSWNELVSRIMLIMMGIVIAAVGVWIIQHQSSAAFEAAVIFWSIGGWLCWIGLKKDKEESR